MPYDGEADGGVVPDMFVQKRSVVSVPQSVLAMPESVPHVEDASDKFLYQPSFWPFPALRLYQTHAADSKTNGWHVWSLSLQAMDGTNPSTVALVSFKLHPTFNPPVHVIQKAPFKAGPFTGWGTFDVKESPPSKKLQFFMDVNGCQARP